MLGIGREPRLSQAIGDAGMNGTQPANRGKKPQRSTLCRFDQARIGARHGGDVTLLDISNDQHFSLRGIVEGAMRLKPCRGSEQMLRSAPCFRCVPIAAALQRGGSDDDPVRSEEHTSELQSLMRISSAVFCLKKK